MLGALKEVRCTHPGSGNKEQSSYNPKKSNPAQYGIQTFLPGARSFSRSFAKRVGKTTIRGAPAFRYCAASTMSFNPLLWSRQPGWKGGDFREPIRRGTGSRARCRRLWLPWQCRRALSRCDAARRYSAANSGLLRSSRIVASSCDVLALRFMMSPLAANTKGGFAAARNLLSRAPRFAPYKPSLTPLPLNVKEERTTASNFGEGPGEIRTHDL